MQAQNTKSLFHFITDQMNKLDQGLISVDEAKAQASLSNQAHNILTYELKRAQMVAEYGEKIRIREVEAKPFDDTINHPKHNAQS